MLGNERLSFLLMIGGFGPAFHPLLQYLPAYPEVSDCRQSSFRLQHKVQVHPGSWQGTEFMDDGDSVTGMVLVLVKDVFGLSEV